MKYGGASKKILTALTTRTTKPLSGWRFNRISFSLSTFSGKRSFETLINLSDGGTIYPKAKSESLVSFGLDANRRISYFDTLLPKNKIIINTIEFYNLDHVAL